MRHIPKPFLPVALKVIVLPFRFKVATWPFLGFLGNLAMRSPLSVKATYAPDSLVPYIAPT
jgi:hypothetical protein